MDTIKFLSTVLGDEGYYCVVGIKDGKTLHKFFSSLDSVVATATDLDIGGFDTYFTPSTFVDGGNRKAENVRQVKSLFLDLDCGEDKPFKTQHEAISALRDFRRRHQLPSPSIIVNSGRGVHVYWVLDKPCTREEWLPVAQKLKAACLQANFEIDKNVTADAARLLRVPNTHNFKGSPALDVRVLRSTDDRVNLQDFANRLPDYLIPVTSVREYSEQDKADMQAVLGNYTKKFAKLIMQIAEGRGCNQVKKALDKPNELSYLEWFHVLSIVKYCEEGDKAAHLISKGYEGYSEEETQKVLDSISWPHYCATFEKDSPEGCEGCPHKGKIKSPIKLCMEVREATSNVVEVPEDHRADEEFEDVESEALGSTGDESEYDAHALIPRPKTVSYTIPPYPHPYFRGAEGGVYIRARNKENEPVELKVLGTDLYPIRRLRDPVTGPCTLFRHHTIREGIREFVIPNVQLSAKDTFRTSLGMQDIMLLNPTPLMEYVNAWVSHLQATQDEVKVRTQFGWTDDCKSFIVGDRQIFADKITNNPPGNRTAQYFPYFRKRGSLEKWKEIPKLFNQPGFEPHQYMFGLTFGSPLMEFVPNIAGTIFHLKSEDSGRGKSTGMYAGASVWGDSARIVQKGKDTGNAIWNRAEVWKNIVLYVDEISNHEPKALSDFAYAITDGEQKNRLSNRGFNEERMRGDQWSLSAGSTANNSILERMTKHRAMPKGEAQRVIEEEAPPLPDTEGATKIGTYLNSLLAENYGHAGDVYIQYVIQNIDTVRQLVTKTVEHINQKAKLAAPNRFWAAQTGTTIAGCRIAKNLGLIDWDVDSLLDWVIKKLSVMRLDMKDMDINVQDLISQYYQDNIRGILRIKSTDDARIEQDTSQFINPDATPFYRWVARHEYDANKLFIVPKPFKEWCVTNNFDYSAIKTKLTAEMGCTATKVRLGRGTKINLPPQHVLVITWREELEDAPADGVTKH
jgi:hypothetical protein